MKREEIFFLCVLMGAEEIVGIPNPVEGMDNQNAMKKWKAISEHLYKKAILFTNPDGSISMDDTCERWVAAIAFPEMAIVLSKAEGMDCSIYVRGETYICLTDDGENELKCFASREEFNGLLERELLLGPCESEVHLEIPLKDMNDGLSLWLSNERDQAALMLEKSVLNKSDVITAMEVLTGGLEARDFVGCRLNQETPNLAVCKTISTEEGTWLFKASGETMKICRCNADTMIKKILYC